MDAGEIFPVGAVKYTVMFTASFTRPKQFVFVTVRLQGIDW
jgi:hypothetical protein